MDAAGAHDSGGSVRVTHLRDGAVLICCAAIIYGLGQWNTAMAWIGGGVVGIVLLVLLEKEIMRRNRHDL